MLVRGHEAGLPPETIPSDEPAVGRSQKQFAPERPDADQRETVGENALVPRHRRKPPRTTRKKDGQRLTQLALRTRLATAEGPPPLPVIAPELPERVQRAARQLWAEWAADPKVRLDLEVAMEQKEFQIEGCASEANLLGKLIGATPVAESSGNEPLPPLRVAILACATGPHGDERDSLGAALNVLRQAPELDLLMAPEWFLVAPDGFLSENEFRHVCGELCRATRGRDTLVVPGTIAWKDAQGEYHNTALAISDGQVLLRHDKRIDGEDSDFAASCGCSWRPGKKPGFFTWRGRQVGLEICRDHGDGLVRWDMRHAGIPALDLQLIVSSGVALKYEAVADGGVIVLAQGDPTYPTTVIRRHSAESSHEAEYPSVAASSSSQLADGLALEMRVV